MRRKNEEQVNLFLFAIMSFCCYSQDRWRFVGNNVWDIKTATKLDARRVKFFYEYPYLEAQREFAIRSGTSPQVAAQIKYGRSGVVVNCKTSEYGFFSVTFLNSQQIPVAPSETFPLTEVKLSPIEPETNMEDLMFDVCRYFKIK